MRVMTVVKSGTIFNRLFIYNVEGIPRYSFVRTGRTSDVDFYDWNT